MNKSAILHIPLSQYAFAEDGNVLTIRLRAARNDLSECVLFYGDRACRKSPVEFKKVPMERFAWDDEYDYFEAVFKSPYERVCYYFFLKTEEEEMLYYADSFHEGLTDLVIDGKIVEGRSEYYQYPFMLREECLDVPKWFKNSVVYNIFPDSFADGRRSISCKGHSLPNGELDSSRSRLGGTIRGIIENLDYISDLGFDCIYLNPIFVAGEWHKYDILNYYHVDPCFGTDEDFKELVKKVHDQGMHIIIDGVFNHCSWYFFAFDDVVKKGAASKYCDWFYDLKFPVRRPEREDEIPGYSCFAYERKMPKLNTSNPEVQQYFAEVGRYWIREFEVDGWRLDVANEIDRNFWRNFRKNVKEEKKDAVLIGEVWENAETWLRGDAFDSTMNYDFRKVCRDFLALESKNSHEFIGEMQKMLFRYPRNISLGQLNLLDTHDVPRFFSLCNCNRDRFKLSLIILLLFPGVPSVFYGDELGIKGVSEHEYRSPMAWERAEDELASFIKTLIAIRKKYISPDAPLIIPETGNVGLFSFQRMSADSEITVYMNTLDKVEVQLCKDAEVLLEANCSGRVLEKYGFLIVLNKRKDPIQTDIPMFYKRQ